nr:MAG TPA: hypothetical protein [Microviridae sp.]
MPKANPKNPKRLRYTPIKYRYAFRHTFRKRAREKPN